MGSVLRQIGLVLWLIAPAGQTAQALSVRDDAGRVHAFEQPVTRIVSLAPAITENLFAVGAGGLIVGASSFSDYPEAAKDIPVVGDASQINYERVLELEPDVVIAWGSGTGRMRIERLEKLGLPVFVSEPATLADIPATLRRFGLLTGHIEQGEAAARTFEQAIGELPRHQGEPVPVFFQLWHQPLMTVGGTHIISEAIRFCGGENVFDALPTTSFSVDREVVIQRRPAVIVLQAGGEQITEQALKQWRSWPQVPAVANGHVAVFPADILARATPRFAEGVARLCEAIAAAAQ